VLHPVDNRTPLSVRELRRSLLAAFGCVILSASATHHLSAEEKDSFLEDEFRQRTVPQYGQDHIEFNVKIANYPERAQLDQPNPLPRDINHWLGTGRAGLYLEVIGFGTSTTVLLQLSCLPYVQIWKRRKHDAPFLDPP